MPTKKKTDFVHSPLSVLYSCRIRLDDSQRDAFRKAHRDFRVQYAPEPVQPVMAGSTLTVETASRPPVDAYKAFGLSDLVVSDLIGSRETIPLTTVIQLQHLLGVEIVTRKELEAKFKSYLDYVLVG